MDLRICFENGPGVNVDDNTMARHYCTSYLADFSPEWGGFIALPHDELVEGRMQPVWQVFLHDADERRVLDYLARNPVAGYHTHAYRMTPTGSVKIA